MAQTMSKSMYDTQMSKIAEDYKAASVGCNSLTGNAKDICVKEAKDAEIAAEGQAKALMTTAQAHATAKTMSNEANLDADKKASEARATASANDTEANYAVAKEKCQAYA
jgi:uncharacterized protein YabE (DUF348 family)